LSVVDRRGSVKLSSRTCAIVVVVDMVLVVGMVMVVDMVVIVDMVASNVVIGT
jgi:hypothetical protein